MNALKLLAVAAVACFPGVASAIPQHPALYSFTDVYRLTVSSSPVPGPAPEETQPVRVASAPAPSAAEASFTVRPASPRPGKWLLLLSGLALAGWVAHRRLAQL